MTFTRCIPRLPSQAIYLLEARHLKCTEESDLFSESIENRQRTLPSFAQAIMLLCLYSPFSVSVQTISSSSLLAFSRVPPILTFRCITCANSTSKRKCENLSPVTGQIMCARIKACVTEHSAYNTDNRRASPSSPTTYSERPSILFHFLP